MKRITAIITTITFLCISIIGIPAISASESGISVSVTPTNIEATGVINTSGYGSIYFNPAAINPDNIYYENPLRYALIDSEGNFIFPYRDSVFSKNYNSISFYESLYGPGGYVVSEEDGIITECIEESVNYEGKRGGFYGLDGKPVLTDLGFMNDLSEQYQSEPLYVAICPFSEGVAYVRVRIGSLYDAEHDKCYLINNTGNIIYELPDIFTDFVADDGMNRMIYGGDCMMAGEGLIPFINRDRELGTGWHANAFKYYVTSSGYMDFTGNVVMEFPGYYSPGTFHESMAYIGSIDTNLFGYINKSGEFAIPCKYELATQFNDGIAGVKLDGKAGYINSDDETVIPFEYDSVFGAGDGLCSVGKDGKFGFVDYSNNIVVPLEYDDVSIFVNGVAYAIKDCEVYILKIDGSSQTAPVQNEADKIKVTFNGTEISFDQSPIIVNDRTLVPLRAIFEAMGAAVDWNQETQTVTSNKGDISISLTIGNNIMYRNDAPIELDVPAQVVNDRTLVPVRAIAEAYDAQVNWDNDSRTVVIIQ